MNNFLSELQNLINEGKTLIKTRPRLEEHADLESDEEIENQAKCHKWFIKCSNLLEKIFTINSKEYKTFVSFNRIWKVGLLETEVSFVKNDMSKQISHLEAIEEILQNNKRDVTVPFLNPDLKNQTKIELSEKIKDMPEYDYFVAHTFRKKEKDDLRDAIESAFEGQNLKAYYADIEIRESGTHILDKILEKIRETRFSIFDITDGNPNVCLELGLAKGSGRPFYIICQRNSDKIPSDLKGFDRIDYESYKELTDSIKKKILPKVLELPKIKNPVIISDYPKPKVFAYLRHEKLVSNQERSGMKPKPLLGIFVENAGRGVAWNGKIEVISPNGKSLYKDVFTRIYPSHANEYPFDKDLPIDDSVEEKREIIVKIDYKDENEKEYSYKEKIGIPEGIRFPWHPKTFKIKSKQTK